MTWPAYTVRDWETTGVGWWGDSWVGQLKELSFVCHSIPSEFESADFFTNPPESIRLQDVEIHNHTNLCSVTFELRYDDDDDDDDNLLWSIIGFDWSIPHIIETCDTNECDFTLILICVYVDVEVAWRAGKSRSAGRHTWSTYWGAETRESWVRCIAWEEAWTVHVGWFFLFLVWLGSVMVSIKWIE